MNASTETAPTKIDGGELITLSECLSRLHLESLLTDEERGEHGRGQGILVRWDGYPVPFSCGYTRDNPDGTPQRERVSQHLCGGSVLFSFARYGKGGVGETPSYHYQLNSSVVIVVDNHAGDTVLRYGITV